jgi:hypothetical protein
VPGSSPSGRNFSDVEQSTRRDELHPRQLQADASEKLGKGSIDRPRNRGEQLHPHRPRAGPPSSSGTAQTIQVDCNHLQPSCFCFPSDSVGSCLCDAIWQVPENFRSKLLRFFFRPLLVAKTIRPPSPHPLRPDSMDGKICSAHAPTEVNQTDESVRMHFHSDAIASGSGCGKSQKSGRRA